MKTKRPLAPSFMNKWDRYLLLYRPQAWTARTHLVLYYGLLFFIALAAVCYLAPDDPRTSSTSYIWVTFVTLLSFIGFVVWMIYLLRFNVFKRYGITSPLDRLRTYLLLFIATAVFVLFPFVHPRIESARANTAYPDSMITRDVNTMNMDILRLEYDSLQHDWQRDTLVQSVLADEEDILPPSVEETPMDVVTTDTTLTSTTITANSWHPRLRLVSKPVMDSKLAHADSVQRLNDSTYIFLDCPDYAFMNTYHSEALERQPLSPAGLYRKMIQNPGVTDATTLRNEVNSLVNKYRLDEPDYYSYDTTHISRIMKRYHVSNVNGSLNNIMLRKKRWEGDFMNFVAHTFMYATMILSLLVFVFRHSTVKTFFLSLLTAVVLMILTLLIQVFSERSNNAFYNWMLFYFLLFLGVSIGTFFTQKRRVVHGVAINLFVLLLPFVPLILTLDYYAYKQARLGYLSTLYLNKTQHVYIAEWVGLALLLVAIATYIHRLYRRWYALAEE